MTHKKYKAYTLILLIVTITALVITAAMISLKKKSTVAAQGQPVATLQEPDMAYYTPKPASSQENSETEENLPKKGYLVTLYKGRIGVFQEGKTLPVLTADAQVYLLPQADIELLRKGIWAESLNEAKSILEDYD
ncbi:hypothetical protein D7X94_06650 [Acutalibacter sp. 1XD8-33]|uniref:hypothetical protein n=1 Tax=Acutalibacter sp. 1XD8-33 TaxID=2320081 RepID=UPI000EA23CE6|nr:hypothetical protein [Acutalibacter sp. 1XD8-33]RKJ40736.1 hypothetical protein D7X94_06650 [Acutalibacter sp. 1XD8-33]